MKKILGLSMLILLTACTGTEVKSALGLKKHAPDEFMVLSRPALTVPPTFDLPAPQDASVAPPSSNAANIAKQVVLGSDNTKAKPDAGKKGKKAESLFLDKAGADAANDSIRQQIEDDIQAENPPAPQDDAEGPGFFGRLFSPIKLDDKPDPIVNPLAEKERIKTAKEDGGKVTGEDAATIQPKGESLLDRIF